MKTYINLNQFKAILSQASFTEQEIEYLTTVGSEQLKGNKKGYYMGYDNYRNIRSYVVCRNGCAVSACDADKILKFMTRRAQSIRNKIICNFDFFNEKKLAGFDFDMTEEQKVELLNNLGVKRDGYKITEYGTIEIITIDAWYIIHMIAKVKQAKIDATNKRKESIRKKQVAEICQLSDNINWHGLGFSLPLKVGSNFDGTELSFGKQNSVSIDEYTVWKEYTKHKSWPVTHRTLKVTLRRGWRIRAVGGIITFYKGTFDRNGMAVEWVEQGRSIADIHIIKGYLVRGEHIQSKSLEEAKRINADHRADILANTIEARRKTIYYREHEDELVVTFNDSLKSGNCRPGTMNFKNRYEEAIGQEVNSITVGELRKYAKKFGCTYYAERAIKYALNHIK